LKRFTVVLTVLVMGVTGVALAASGAAKIKLRKTSIGKILTNGSGRTVYMFTRDTKNTDKCMKIKFCTSTWPPVVSKGRPVAGPGVKASLLGTIKLSNGKHQVTYAGHPLYTYAGDTGPGQTSYVGIPMFGGKWNALSASGKIIK
jgi:predicted lipoprotein with Yx(FWY)xxD motif